MKGPHEPRARANSSQGHGLAELRLSRFLRLILENRGDDGVLCPFVSCRTRPREIEHFVGDALPRGAKVLAQQKLVIVVGGQHPVRFAGVQSEPDEGLNACAFVNMRIRMGDANAL